MQVEHDELEMGIASEPSRAIATDAEWLRRWNAGGQACAIMQPEEYQRLRDADTPKLELAGYSRCSSSACTSMEISA